MDLKKTLNSEKSIFVISFIWGMALAVMCLRKCTDGYCVVVNGPKKEDIEGNIYKVDGKCYKFESRTSECKKNNLPIKPDVLKNKNLF